MPSNSIDEQWIALRVKMLEFEQALAASNLPDGVYMHNATMQIEARFAALLQQAWIEVANAKSLLDYFKEQEPESE